MARSPPFHDMFIQCLINSCFMTIKKLLQEKYFSKDLIALKNKSKNSLSSLDPFVDDLGLIRVGGRLSRCAAGGASHVTFVIMNHFAAAAA